MRRRIGVARNTICGLAIALAVGSCGTADESGEARAGAMGESGASESRAPSEDHLNPMITLHDAGLPVFGLYAPSPRAGRAAPGEAPPPEKTPAMRAEETLEYGKSDYVFDGSMERSVESGLPTFTEFASAMREVGASARSHPFVVKAAKIESAEQTNRDVGLQLDAGVSGIMFVGVESADEVRTGLSAMRYPSQGGTRPRGVGTAPSYWGVGEAEYREKADLWPLNPEGELISWVIVESHEGLANVREIAAVPGIGVLWPGAGTLRGLFTSTNADGERVRDEDGWENAIQTVLAACKEFEVPCGYPANAEDIEMRMEQGFSVFVMGWGESGFATVERGRELAGR